MLLASVEGLGVEHDAGAVPGLGAGDVAFSSELHPGHSQDGPEGGTGVKIRHTPVRHMYI